MVLIREVERGVGGFDYQPYCVWGGLAEVVVHNREETGIISNDMVQLLFRVDIVVMEMENLRDYIILIYL